MGNAVHARFQIPTGSAWRDSASQYARNCNCRFAALHADSKRFFALCAKTSNASKKRSQSPDAATRTSAAAVPMPRPGRWSAFSFDRHGTED